ncbi:hypothetical protein Ciccas_000364 [Cichlidogyrus casuarinus]|uniref:Nudix hydrolase domain-containing protein n=1 Tax=Cichlidogyrus casuarinus TaxID=1844966 RepID=A0ABD2QN32_9PLAT
MIHRPASMKAFADMSTFPGGKVDAADFKNASKLGQLDHAQCRIPETVLRQITADLCISNHQIEIGFKLAALRETFEETGHLVSAKKADRSCHVTVLDRTIHNNVFFSIQQRPEMFINLYSELGLDLPLEQTRLWSNWTSPLSLKHRFNTCMFHAHVEKVIFLDRKVEAFGNLCDYEQIKEVDAVYFASPAGFLKGKMKPDRTKPAMAPPQSYELQRFCNFLKTDDLLHHIDSELQKAKIREWNSIWCEYTPKSSLDSKLIYVLTGDDLFEKIPMEYHERAHPKYQLTDHDWDQKSGLNRIVVSREMNDFWWKCSNVIDGHKPPISEESFNELFGDL